MVIVFDLDDTLYEELSYVRSGFRVVAAYLSPLLALDQESIYQALLKELLVKREEVFNRFLQKQGLFSGQLVKRCVSVYRGHDPAITLYPEAYACLQRLQSYPLYIVTDGNKLVQKRKFLALGLIYFVKRCFFTYAHGLHRKKPSPYCFEKICKLELVSPAQVVYVADNPHKDFVGLKPLGFQTIRVLTGPYKDMVVSPEHDADITIANLQELDEAIINRLEEAF